MAGIPPALYASQQKFNNNARLMSVLAVVLPRKLKYNILV